MMVRDSGLLFLGHPVYSIPKSHPVGMLLHGLI